MLATWSIAILDGVVTKKLFAPEHIIVSNPHTDKLEHPKALGVQVTCDKQSGGGDRRFDHLGREASDV